MTKGTQNKMSHGSFNNPYGLGLPSFHQKSNAQTTRPSTGKGRVLSIDPSLNKPSAASIFSKVISSN